MATKKALSKAEDLLEEYMKCKEDFFYFCPNYIKIELPGGDEALNLYKPQEVLMRKAQLEHNIIVLKSRQIGISTITQAYATWLLVFHKNVVIGIISKDAPEATDFARKIRGMIEKLPIWMLPKKGAAGIGFAKKSEQSFILTNGSKLYVSTVNPNAPSKTLRGKAITFLIIDEAAFINYLDEAWTAMVPALSTNQMHAQAAGVPYGTMILSTPNKTMGSGAWFYQKYMNAVADPDGIMKSHVIHWKDIKELAEDPVWYSNQCALFDNDPRKIQQELELKFLPSEGSFFGAETAERVQSAAVIPIKTNKTFGGEEWFFEEPDSEKMHIIGVDTATEFGKDKSAITVWDYETMNLIYEYQGKCPVEDFCRVVTMAIARFPGLLVIEGTGGYGNHVYEVLDRSDFSQYLYKETRTSNSKQWGPLSTNMKSRQLMMEALYTYVTDFPEAIRSQRLGLELIGLVQKPSGKVEADIGCNDDLALSASFAFYIKKYKPLDISMFICKHPNLMRDIQDINNLNDFVDTERWTNRRIKQEISDMMDNNKNGEYNFFDSFDIINRG